MKVKIILICLGLFVMLAGCQASPEDKIYNIIEKTVSKEKEFDAQQKPLVELESKEKDIFDQIMKLGLKDFDKVVKLSDSALENLNKRRDRMKKEEDSITKSKKEFSEIKAQIDHLKSDKLKVEAKNLFELMENRYDAHEELYKAYNKGIDSDIKLYKMFKEKDIQLDELEKQIDITNAAYADVLAANKQFNEKTKTFNNNKLKFYKDANIKIASK